MHRETEDNSWRESSVRRHYLSVHRTWICISLLSLSFSFSSSLIWEENVGEEEPRNERNYSVDSHALEELAYNDLNFAKKLAELTKTKDFFESASPATVEDIEMYVQVRASTFYVHHHSLCFVRFSL